MCDFDVLVMAACEPMDASGASGALDQLKKCSFLRGSTQTHVWENDHVQILGKCCFLSEREPPRGVVTQQSKGCNHIPDSIRTHFYTTHIIL